MSSSSQTAARMGPTSLPLFKLSFCTTPTLQAKLMWTHLAHQLEMFAVFDRVRRIGLNGSIAESKVLRLTRGGDLLEQIELDDLVLQVRLDEERIKSKLLQDSDRHVILIIKRPLVALRYRLPDNQIRRLQLNFQPESGYDVTVKTFISLGLPIKDKNTPCENPRPPTLSTQSQPPLYHNPCPDGSSTPQPASYQDPGFKLPSQSQMYQYPGSNVCSAPSQPSAYEISEFEMPPTSSQPPLNQHPTPIQSQASPEVYQGLTVPDVPITKMGNSPGSVPNVVTYGWIPYDIRPTSSAPELCSARPEPVAASISQMLPPKRILPFPPKKSVPAITEPQVERSISDTPQPPVETAPASTTVLKKRNVKAKSTTTKASAPRPRGKKIVKPIPRAPKPSSANVRIDTGSNDIPPVAETSPSRLNVVSPISTCASSSPKSRPTSPLQPTTAKKRPQNPPTTGSEPPSKPHGKPFDDIQPAEFLARLDNWVREFRDFPTPRPLRTDAESLATYAAQPKADRLAALDQLICECLEDANFGKLVEDVAESWKRVGLGF